MPSFHLKLALRAVPFLALVGLSCGDDFVIGEPDAGADPVISDPRPDVGVDSGADAGAGAVDAPAADSGAMDTGVMDTGAMDTGAMDAGFDSGEDVNESIRVIPHENRLVDGFWEMTVIFFVPPGAPPAGSAPGALSLRYDGGVEVSGVRYDKPSALLRCSEMIRATEGTSLPCRVRFPVAAGAGVPVELIYRAEGRIARSPFPTCSTAAPAGRCDTEGFQCSAGVCRPTCADPDEDIWEVCFSSEWCEDNECLAVCSPHNPDDGFCPTGTTCVDGECL